MKPTNYTVTRLTAIAGLATILVLGIVAAFAPVAAQGPEGDFTPLTDHAEQMAAWAASPHGNTYDPGKGPNTYCSRCHSPQNWDPAARPGPPPNCITCHFAHEAEMRIAETMDFVPEEEWVGIYCDTCHVVDGDRIDTTRIVWFNPIAEEYIPMATPNQLCEQCHVNSTGVSETGGRGVDHAIILGGSAHSNWAATIGERRPDYCSDCHDPHTQQPKACVDCHAEVLELPTHVGEDLGSVHVESVSCIACHDASGADVAPHPDEAMGGMWTTVETSISRSGDVSVVPIVSHSVQWLVACDRCHFADNPWELDVLTAEGEVPDNG